LFSGGSNVSLKLISSPASSSVTLSRSISRWGMSVGDAGYAGASRWSLPSAAMPSVSVSLIAWRSRAVAMA